MNIGEWWELQESGRKKTIAIAGGLVALVLVLALIPKQEKSEKAEVVSPVEVDILGDDQGAGDMQQMAAAIKVLEKELEGQKRTNQNLTRRVQQTQNALSAATGLNENPEQIGALVDEMNRMREDMDELKQEGIRSGNSGAAAPVQLVLGGEQNSVATPGGTTDPTTPLTSPFSDAIDDEPGAIASWDPLARVKGAIEEGASNKPSSSGGGINFLKDSNFERPPAKIVIEEATDTVQRTARSGGSRPGQTSRDRRGELIDVQEMPEIYIPSGTLFEGVLLNGMDAPTKSSSARDPYPATIRLTSLAFLPNRFTTNVRECFVGAAGFGRLDSERVHLRTETLSCVLSDGGIIDVSLQGYVTGEDGKVGLRGVVVERTGQLLMRAALAGLGSGLAMALSPRQIASVQTGGAAGGIQFDRPETSEVLEIGAYQGAATAMEKVADFYLDRADEIFPIIEIDAMRRVTIHMTAGVSLKRVDGHSYGPLAKNESTR